MNVNMMPGQLVSEVDRMTIADVSEVTASGKITVRTDGQEFITCNHLCVTDSDELTIEIGDRVLIWLPRGDGEDAVVLGRVGPKRASTQPVRQDPDELVIEAKRSLTFRCGDGSITLREDGKVVIKGKDLISHAKRVNRIRGGSVTIN